VTAGAPAASTGTSPAAALADAQQRLTQLNTGLSQVDADVATANQDMANGG
jgi:hypothetical protein